MKDHEEADCEVFDKEISDGLPINLGTSAEFHALPVRVEDCTGRVRDI